MLSSGKRPDGEARRRRISLVFKQALSSFLRKSVQRKRREKILSLAANRMICEARLFSPPILTRLEVILSLSQCLLLSHFRLLGQQFLPVWIRRDIREATFAFGLYFVFERLRLTLPG